MCLCVCEQLSENCNNNTRNWGEQQQKKMRNEMKKIAGKDRRERNVKINSRKRGKQVGKRVNHDDDDDGFYVLHNKV